MRTRASFGLPLFLCLIQLFESARELLFGDTIVISQFYAYSVEIESIYVCIL